MSHRLKQIVGNLRQSIATRFGSTTTQFGGLVLASLLAVGVSGSFAGDEEPASGKRWVTASLVNLRATPGEDGEVLKRLALNTEIELLSAPAGSQYCEIRLRSPGGGEMRGFAACRFLAGEPLSKRRIAMPYLDYGKNNPDYDPQRAFWLEPSYAALSAYGDYLESTRLSEQQRFDPEVPRPRDAEFERMKSHLALGVYGPVPVAYPAWSELKRVASAWERERAQIVGSKIRKYGTEQSEELQAVASRHARNSAVTDFGQQELQALGLVASIELPAVKPSLFKRADELAPPSEAADQVSGRFRIVHTVQTRGRKGARGEEGVWDIGEVTASLTRPVMRNVLFRDGAVAAAPSHLKRTYVEWGSVDGPMCEGYEDGFAWGDADPAIWVANGFGEAAYAQSHKRNAKGSLMSFYTRDPLPAEKPVVSITRHQLDRERTGFIAATQFHYDLNGDGIPDIAVWEGVGRGPGHLDDPTNTDDAWRRVFFANVAGRWVVLGQDSFGYGCGC